MNLVMIFILLNFKNPKKVLLGKWVSDKFTITLDKIVDNKVIGVYTINDKSIKISGKITESNWDQPCSRAYDCEFMIRNKKMTIKFIGYETQTEVDGSLVCRGNLQGVEGQVIDSKSITFLYRK